ncbi:MAG: SAM-dependent methyltransferase [Anaerolineae bacterium]|nr:SAM-dependent methyltransferase [Anaerolineae bacterium]
MNKKALGDFQTPCSLVQEVLAVLCSIGTRWQRALEPTCGKGNFILGLAALDRPPREIIGIERQRHYVEAARSAAPNGARIIHANIFDVDLRRDLTWMHGGPLLVVGNPPWVTSADLGALESDNLPDKSNFKQMRGIDAITGQANFDIAEYIWLKLITELAHEADVTIALLCKTSVARNVLRYAHESRLPVTSARLYRIDAQKWFGAAVDASLFVLTLDGRTPCYNADAFETFDAPAPRNTVGFVGDAFVSDITTYRHFAFLDGQSPVEWRQGLKHDAASVMELTCKNGVWYNKNREVVEVEDEYIYPLLKSSDLQARRGPRHGVVVTQQHVGQDTHALAYCAPRLWAYLTRHAETFRVRKSSIYHNKPPFSIFGIGDYSFAPYKVCISGLYKQPRFVAVGPYKGKPVMCDDTCYLLPFESAAQVAVTVAVLNHPTTTQFIESIVFWDAKRPITKRLLQRIDIAALIQYLPADDVRFEAQNILSVLQEDQASTIPDPQDVFVSLDETSKQLRLF